MGTSYLIGFPRWQCLPLLVRLKSLRLAHEHVHARFFSPKTRIGASMDLTMRSMKGSYFRLSCQTAKRFTPPRAANVTRATKDDPFLTWMSSAPLVSFFFISATAGMIIEANRFFPDPLAFDVCQSIPVFGC